MKSVNSRIKQALKGFTTQRKGRILVNGNYYEVYNVEYYADCYDEGKVIGNAIASQLDFDLPYMPKFDTFKYYDGVWTGSSYEYVDMGTFNVFDEKDQDEFNKHITAFDNLIKFNVPFEEIGTYPKTLYAELQNICNQAGVNLGNLSIPNGSFIIENNQYVNGESLKTVLKQICGISGNYAIMKDNTLYLQLKNTTDEVLDKYQHTPTDWKRRSYGINQVIIGDSQVEGEYVIREDAEDIELNGVHKLEVLDNLFAYTQDKRDALIDALWNQVRGFGYVPYETSGEWLSYLEIGDTITIDNVETILLRINAKSPKAVESTISAPAIIDSSIEYVDNTNDIKNQLRRTEVKVDKQNQTIELLASEVEETQEIVEIISTPIEEQTEMPMYIENAEGGKLIDLKLYGDTYQETYSGKNLFDDDISNYKYSNSNNTLSQITGGVRSKFTGTTSTINRYSSMAIKNSNNLLGKTCTFSGTITPSASNTGAIKIYQIKSTGEVSGGMIADALSNPTFTFPSELRSDAVGFGMLFYSNTSGTVAQNDYVDYTNIQLEVGSTPTNYEKFVGGIPSPNPEFPQNVETVTGRQEIEVVGENIFVPTLKVGSTNIKTKNCTVTLNKDEYSFVASGTDMYFGEVAASGLSYPKDRGTLYEINDADTIYLYCTNNTFNKNYITFYDENKVSLGYNSINNSKTNGKTVPANAKYFTIRLGYGSAVSGTTYTTKVMVSRHKITDYVPYTSSKYELNLGKNLATFGSGTTTSNQVTTTFNNSSFTIDGTANASGYSFQKVICTLPAGTYTLSTKLASGSKSGTSFQMTLSSATTTYVTIPSNTTDRTATFTLTEETSLTFRLYVNNTNSMTFNNMVINVQIEKGSVASLYSPFKTPIKLCKIGTYKDTIKKSTGKNLFDKDNANTLNAYFGVNTPTITADNSNRTIYIPCNPNTTYTISKKASPNGRAVGTTSSIPAINSAVDNIATIDANNTTITYTTNTNAKYLVIRVWNEGQDSGTTFNQMKNSIQIELGATANDIEPYGVGKWYVSKKIGKEIFDGTENWIASGATVPTGVKAYVNGKNSGYIANTQGYSNYFEIIDNATDWNIPSGNGTARYTSNQLYIKILSTIAPDATTLKTWIASHNIIMYGILATSSYEEITDEELINQLNAIELFEGINNVSIDSGDLTAGVYMKYYLRTPLSGTYVKTEELNAKLTITTEQITSEVNAKYETKTDANGKLIEAKGYTDGQLTNYSTTTEMNSAITQKANEITSTVAETYSTKAETTTAKDEAIASANSTTDDKLSSYSTTSEMNTEIQQTASAINTRINKISTNINEDTGEVESVTTTTGYKFDANGLSISRSDSEFSALHNNTGTYYKDNDAIVSQTTKDGTITKDMVLYGRYFYGVDNDLDVENFTKDDAMFIAEMYEDGNGEIGFGHFLNNLGGN